MEQGSIRKWAKLARAVFGMSALLARQALAADPSAEPPATENSAEPPATEKARLSYWEDGDPRFFVSGRVEAGLYVKPQVAAGFGKPYWMNMNVEAFGISTPSFGAGYGGIRGTLPFADLRVGARYTYSYDRSFLPPKDEYFAADVNRARGPRAGYLSLEAELSVVVPALGGYVAPVFAFYEIVGTPEGEYVFDEALRGILKPPTIVGLRLAYVKNFGRDDFLKVGVLGELVVLPGRPDNIVRVGPAALMTITDHIEAQGTITFVASSPDELGIWHGSFGVLGLVYRWATGDEHPAFP